MLLGKQIQKIRKRAGLTQAELGRRLGVSGSMIGQWEGNHRVPKFETIIAIADALDVSVSQLMKEAGAFVYDPEGLEALDSSIREHYSIDPYDNYIVVPIYKANDGAASLEQIFRQLSLLNSAGIERAATYVCDLAGNPSYQRSPDVPTNAEIFEELINTIPNATSVSGGKGIKFTMSPSEVFPQSVPHKENADDTPE